MKMVQNQQQLKALLKDTITMLCKNSVTFHHEICIEALIGITLDQKDIVLVNINEILPSKGHLETDLSPKVSSKRKRKKTFHKIQTTEAISDFTISEKDSSDGQMMTEKSRKAITEENSADETQGLNSEISACEPVKDQSRNVVSEQAIIEDIEIKSEPGEDFEAVIIKEEPQTPDVSVVNAEGSRQCARNVNSTDYNSIQTHASYSSVLSGPSFGEFQSDSSQSQKSDWMRNSGAAEKANSNNNKYSHLSHLIFTTQDQNDKSQRYICRLCLKQFSHYSALYRHKLNLHGIPRHYPCTECQKPFIRKDNLLRHLKVVHKLDRAKV